MKKPKPPYTKNRADRKKTGAVTLSKELSKPRIWMFRLMMIFLVPAFILGSLELALKAAGYGYPTSYFIKSRIDDKDFLIPNNRFSYRFFPQALARLPVAYRIPAEKPPGVYRVFVFGESAALGDPDPSYGVSRYLNVLLEARYPDTDFEVICVAMTAINSHAILPIARECARLDGDLWVIYMGNNEMVGPFGAGTIFGAKAPGLGFVRTSLALKKTRLGQLMASLISKLGSKSELPTRWGGIKMFKNNLLRHDDPKKLRTYENFEGNLEDILNAGRKAGVPIILSTVGSNLKDCSPFASLHREDLNTSSKREWDLYFQEGMALEKAGQHEEALSRYSDAAAIDSEYAELQFRMGACQLALGRCEQARQAFAQARDHDALAVRADTRINRIVIDATLESSGQVRGMDAAEAFTTQSPEGIPGKELFYEHVHFTAEGTFTLARIIAEQVKTLLPAEILESQTENWLDNEACNRQLVLTVWDQIRLWQKEAARVNTMPYISQTSNASNKEYINKKNKELRARFTSNTWGQVRQLYEAALDQAPEDTFLIPNYAQFLDAAGNSTKAIEQAEKFRTLLPDLEWPNYCLAALLQKGGRLEEARELLENTLELHSDFTQARELLKRINRK